MSQACGRLAAAGALAALLVLTAGCSSADSPRAAGPAGAVGASAAVGTSTGGLPAPFDGRALPLVSLAEGLSQIQRPVSLPETRVAGVPDAVVVNHGPNKANSLWVHYPTGIFLEIHPNLAGAGGELDVQALVAETAGMVHRDGTPYTRLERIAGRDTVVATGGEVLKDGKLVHGPPIDALSWVDDGYVYVVRSLPLSSAPLGLMLKVAASIR